MKLKIIKLIAVISICLSFSFLPIANQKLANFKAIKVLTYKDTTLFDTDYSGITTLYETPTISGLRPYKGQYNGIVKLNSSIQMYNQTINMYMDTALRKNLNVINWSISNSTAFENINYSTIKAMPSFTNVACIPNILSKSSNYMISFGNVPNVDRIEFTIDNGSIQIAPPYYRKVPATINTLVIPKINLSCLNINTTSKVRITFINEEEKDFGNKKFVFENRLEIVKLITITN